MTIYAHTSGHIDVERTDYLTDRPDTFRVKIYAGPDVQYTTDRVFNTDSNTYYGDTTHFFVPPNHTYFVIPFMPTISYEQRNPNGGGWSYYCQCCCLNCADLEPFACLDNGGEGDWGCMGICALCYAVSTGCPGLSGSVQRVAVVGGFVVFDATTITIQ